ncbi:MAG: ABC transporter permease [Acidiferrobacteraceae bacterium]|nr:ABC transporter permease [Acidiferrobacteraceae bacterium]
MSALLTETFITALLFGAVTAGVPLLLAGIGEQISEKAGVLNIGLEGMMLVGAYTGFCGAYYLNSFWLGFLLGGLGGISVAILMVLFCVRLGLNQIVIGIALTLGADGLTALLHHFQFSRTYPRLSSVETMVIPFAGAIPFLGEAFFQRHPIVYFSIVLVFLLIWIFKKTYIGLNLQAAGDVPAALDVTGVSVVSTRTWAVIATGFLAGIGGAFLANVGAGLFVPFMTGGAGFIAIVLAMLARGNPTWVLYGAGLFGVSLSLTTALQVAGFNIPTDVVQMLPFTMVILMLILLGRNSYLPAALTLPYVRGER